MYVWIWERRKHYGNIFSTTILISYSTSTNQTIIVATCYPLTNPSKRFPYVFTHTLSLSLIVIDDWNSLPTPCESFSCLLLLSHDHSFIYYHSSNKIFQYKKNKERNIFYLVNGDRSMLLLPVPLQWWW